jgi:nucleoside-triphosphatase THEP1
VYDDGPAFDADLFALAGRLRADGLKLAGIAQTQAARPGRRRCDMVVEDLSTGLRETISEDRGEGARGCRLDLAALGRLQTLVDSSLQGPVDLLLVNKFGKEEAEGRGLRGTVARAVELGIPVVIGVPRRNLDAFRAFCGDIAEEIAPDGANLDRLVERISRTQPA